MQKEIWAEHPTNTEGTSFTKFEVSNFGRLKIYNNLSPEGRITNGNLVNGVPSYVYKIYKPATEKDAEKLADLDAKYQEARKLASKFRYQATKFEQYKKQRDKLRESKKKLNRKIQKKREVSIILIIHRLVAQYFLEKPSDKAKQFVIHKDFDKTNNHVDNLAWATQVEINARHSQQPKLVLHRFKKQLYNIPTPINHAKLSENDVLYIKNRLKKEHSVEKLAKRFNVSTTTITKIKAGKTWKNVKLVEELLEESKK